jgi:HTH-type transcriptional regulator/antitoxin HigA
MSISESNYEKLLVEYRPRPITSKSALERTYKLIEQLMDKPELSRAESEMLGLLSMLVEQYESQEFPNPKVSAAEMLEHLIESRGISNADLAAATEVPRSTITEILAGRRRISLSNVTKFAEFFAVSPSVFVTPESLGVLKERPEPVTPSRRIPRNLPGSQ